MRELVGKVTNILCRRYHRNAKRLADAKIFYAQCLLHDQRPYGTVQELLAAVDLLELSADDINHDLRTIAAVRRVEDRLADLNVQIKQAILDVRVAEQEVDAAQSTIYPRLKVDKASRAYCLAQRHEVSLGTDLRIAMTEMEVHCKSSPRVFGVGLTRRLAGPILTSQLVPTEETPTAEKSAEQEQESSDTQDNIAEEASV